MKNLLLIILIIICGKIVKAQDTLILRNGNLIPAHVLEVGKTVVKYKQFDNLNGPTFIIDAGKIVTIKFQNTPPNNDAPEKKIQESDFNTDQNVNNQKNNQTTADSLIYKNGNIYQNDKRLSNKEIYTLYKNNSKALNEFASARTKSTLSFLFSTGSIIFSITTISMLINNDSNYPYALVPALMFSSSSLLFSMSSKNAKQRSVKYYNASSKLGVSLNLGFTSNGFGIAMKF